MTPLSPFTVLFDDSADGGPSLPPDLRTVYGGDLRFPPPRDDRPYVYINFAAARDGRVSFNLPGQMGGDVISDHNDHDRWLMALLRARADAVLCGEGTLRVSPDHLWTAQYIFPEEAATFARLRETDGLPPFPRQVFVSQVGEIPLDAPVLSRADLSVVIATTTEGVANLKPLTDRAPHVVALDLGRETVDMRRLMTALRQRYGVRNLLTEGGPRVYGSLLQAGIVDDEFLTLCPIVVGATPDTPRPGLVEGVAFTPTDAPRSRLLSLRRVGDHLFLRSRYAQNGSEEHADERGKTDGRGSDT